MKTGQTKSTHVCNCSILITIQNAAETDSEDIELKSRSQVEILAVQTKHRTAIAQLSRIEWKY